MKRALTGLLLVGALFTALSAPSRTGANTTLAIGQPAPDFTLKDLAGKTHALKDYRGQIVVVGFIATECPISNAYNERMRAIADEYKDRHIVFLGINSNDPEKLSQVREHAKKSHLTFPIFKDEGNKVADAYGAVRTPEMFVIDAEGTLRYHGRIDNNPELPRVKRSDLREALNELLAGKPVSIPQANAFGCAIKRVKASQAAAAPPKASQPETLVALIKPADFPKLKQQAQGKVLIVNFWATWCGPCVAEFPEFVALDAKYRDQGVKIIGISADETADIKSKVIPFVKEAKAKFEIFVQDVDDPQEMIDIVSKEWSGALPATFIFDRQGKLAYSRYGIIDRDQLVAALESALKS